MSDTPKGLKIFDAYNPSFDADTEITVTLSQECTASGYADLPTGGVWTDPGSNRRILRVTGPRYRLDPGEVVGRYPAPDSEDSPANFLPHIALRRATLPWERKTWLALLLLTEEEMGEKSGATTDTSQDGNPVLKIPASLLRQCLPLATNATDLGDLSLLCHMREVPESAEEARLDDDGRVAIVIGGRLPAPKMTHHVGLVSLEQLELSDLAGRGSVTLPLLDHWTFKTAKGGDFQQVMGALTDPGHGGVMALGLVPGGLLGRTAVSAVDGFCRIVLDDGTGHEVAYRGPAVPPGKAAGLKDSWKYAVALAKAPSTLRDTSSETSAVRNDGYLAAFELGRLLTLGNQEVLDRLSATIDSTSKLPPPRIIIDREWRTIPDPLKQLLIEKFESRINWPDVLQAALVRAYNVDPGANRAQALVEKLGPLCQADATRMRAVIAARPELQQGQQDPVAGLMKALELPQTPHPVQPPAEDLKDLDVLTPDAVATRFADLRGKVQGAR